MSRLVPVLNCSLHSRICRGSLSIITGSPCVLNLRYVADTVKSSNRTAASAIYTLVSALGMSLGPGLAVILDFVDIESKVPVLGYVEINGMSAPGFFMAFLWSVYYYFLWTRFFDEDRIGLREKDGNIETDKNNYNPPTAAALAEKDDKEFFESFNLERDYVKLSFGQSTTKEDEDNDDDRFGLRGRGLDTQQSRRSRGRRGGISGL